MLRWVWDRMRTTLPPDPDPSMLPRAEPAPVRPRVPADGDEVRITWIGHATFLVQLPGVNVLTDPVFSRRASPVSFAGPARFTPAGMTVESLPPIDVVIQSHDHYDHLDSPSVKALRDRFGDDLTWLTPLGYERWYAKKGVARVVALDWWQSASLETAPGGRLEARALPAQHWTRRRMWDTFKRLWSSWGLEAGGRRVYFGGDSGYCPAFAEIGRREEPFDVALMPIGAYEPRWFMRSSHMNPEEAVQACREVRARALIGMHWGTFRLTDEDPLEPPLRTRGAWEAVGLEPEDLYIPAHGETVAL